MTRTNLWVRHKVTTLCPLLTDWYSSYFDHLADAWDNYRDDPDVYFLYFEKLKQVGTIHLRILQSYLPELWHASCQTI